MKSFNVMNLKGGNVIDASIQLWYQLILQQQFARDAKLSFLCSSFAEKRLETAAAVRVCAQLRRSGFAGRNRNA